MAAPGTQGGRWRHGGSTVTSDTEFQYWIAFSQIPTVGRVRLGLLEGRFGSLEIAWGAGASELRAAGLDQNVVNAVTEHRGKIDPARELARIKASGVAVVTWYDADYPALLREIDDLPPILYMRGEFPQESPSITIVGTRRPTAYGREVAAHVAGELAEAGVAVISGLARGIDGIAHRTSLKAHGRTVAVLGCGVDVVYPAEHAQLTEEIAESGAILSEYPLGTKPEGRHFPRRNRLLSGLSVATLVIEAGEGSGTLSAVKFALEQNREVLCVPGSIYSPASTLTNRLIQEGAKPILNVKDVLDEIRMMPRVGSQPELPGLTFETTADEAAIYDALAYEPQHVDDLSRATGLPVTSITGSLTVMELQGRVLQVGRMNYIRAREPKATYGASEEK
jgi:DNA processing protein